MRNKLEDKKATWGVVQQLVVEADTYISLTAAVTIALTYHHAVNGATHFVETLDDKGFSLLTIHNGTYGADPKLVKELPFPLKTADAIAEFVRMWLLHKAEYPRKHMPDTDGDVNHGFRAEIIGYSEVISVKAHFIVYSK